MSLVYLIYYCTMVGKLYHYIVFRYDINFAMGIVSHFLVAPQEPYLATILQIWQNLKTTVDLVGCYCWKENVKPFDYKNSNYA